MRLEIIVAGLGGQGIIRAGLMLTMAASIYGERNAVQTRSYGPEARGGACKSEVVVSDEEIDFPNACIVFKQSMLSSFVKGGNA